MFTSVGNSAWWPDVHSVQDIYGPPQRTTIVRRQNRICLFKSEHIGRARFFRAETLIPNPRRRFLWGKGISNCWNSMADMATCGRMSAWKSRAIRYRSPALQRRSSVHSIPEWPARAVSARRFLLGNHDLTAHDLRGVIQSNSVHVRFLVIAIHLQPTQERVKHDQWRHLLLLSWPENSEFGRALKLLS